ncbi:MAG: hypothetical protein JSS20_15405, partial [Proteobacteria bacterium]|nr:hypothetical protein [Pseudomonadota bacterium]
MTLWKWSQTAASNATADSTVNWQENQAPRTLNDSARAMMAAVAKYRDDISGNLVTGGTSTAYTVSTNQVLGSLTDGFMLRVRVHVTSGATPTFSPDSLTAKNIRSVYGTALPNGALLANGVYTLVYDSTDDAWIVGERFGDTMSTGDNPDLVAIEALSGTTGALRKTAANTWTLDDGTTAIIFEKDGGGNALSTGIQGDAQIPFACTITGVTLLADQSGSCVLDIWKDTYANYPPTNADTITASAKPTLSTALKFNDTTLTGWTTAVAAGDTLRFN